MADRGLFIHGLVLRPRLITIQLEPPRHPVEASTDEDIPPAPKSGASAGDQPQGVTLNIANLQAMSMNDLNQMAREMGIENFHLTSSLLAILAQRLVRVLCTRCKEPYTPREVDLGRIDVEPEVERIAGRTDQRGLEHVDAFDDHDIGRTEQMWELVNHRNLVEHIEPTRAFADIVVEKGPEHAVTRVEYVTVP